MAMRVSRGKAGISITPPPRITASGSNRLMLVAMARAAFSSRLWTKGRFPHGRKDRSMGNFGAVVRTSVLAPFQSNWFQHPELPHAQCWVISPGDMAQFACHTVCTRPRRTVHPHCEPHPRTEIGRQNQLLRKAVFYYVPESCRLTSRENSTGQFSVFSSLSARSYKSAAVNGRLGVEIMVRLSLLTSAGNPITRP